MKVLKTVAVIAGAVALIATGVGAAAGAGLFGAAGVGAAGTVAGISVGTIATIASVATVVGVAASIGAQLLYKEPQARAAGSMNQIIVEREAPRPYLIGRTYSAGVLRHDAGYGATENEVPNPNRGMVVVHSGVGPVDGVESHQVDYEAVDFPVNNGAAGYYNNHLWREFRLGTHAETAIYLGDDYPDWGSDYKLSGHFATGWKMRFDREGKRFASGIPRLGVIARGVKTYDPRQDSTYPGGSGSCRVLDETTYVYQENPSTHALTYALGRFAAGKRVFGIGIAAAALVLADFVAFANVCDANAWTTGGVIYEPADRWANLKDILAAGGAEPVWKGARLGLKWSAPHVAVGSIDVDDLADDDTEIEACRSYSVRLNGRVPKYRSEEHQWEYVSAGEVVVDQYVTEDGEKKVEERQWNLVQDKDQVAQLAAYDLVNRRELGPIEVVCKPHMRTYRAGDCLTVHLPQLGLVEQDCLVLQRTIDPATLKVHFTLETETVAKHDFALGRTGTPPPTPRLVDSEQRDLIAGAVITTTWSGLIDDGGKPEDNATVGAPAGTFTGSIASELVAPLLDFNAEHLIEQTLRGDALQAFQNAIGLIDGVGVNTVLQEFREEQTTENEAFAQTFNIMGAEVDGGTAFQFNAAVVRVKPGESLATTIDTLEVTQGNQTASISHLEDVLIDPSGVTVRQIDQQDVNGYIIGSITTNDGTLGKKIYRVDVFGIVALDGEGEPFFPFLIEDGIVKMGTVEIDTIRPGTKGTMGLPVILTETSDVAGAGMGSPLTLLSTNVTLEGPGTIFANAVVKLTHSGDNPFAIAMYINGSKRFQVDGLGSQQDGVPVMGTLYQPAAGTFSVQIIAELHASITAKNRTLFATPIHGAV